MFRSVFESCFFEMRLDRCLVLGAFRRSWLTSPREAIGAFGGAFGDAFGDGFGRFPQVTFEMPKEA